MGRQRLVIVGAGGFAREVAWLAREITAAGGDEYELLGYVVSDLTRLGEHDSRDEVLGDYGWLQKNRDAVDCLALGIGTPRARLRVAADLQQAFPAMRWPPLIHPTARYDATSCEFGPGSMLCAGVIATVNVVLEPFAMVNLACTLGHEARIGRASCLNPTVNISGGVTLEAGVLVGTGAQILQYVTVGTEATVGAGALVHRDVAPGVTVVGVPAKPLNL